MSNEEILNQRWKNTDKTLKNYLKKFNDLGQDTIDELIEMFGTLDITYNDLNKTISKAEKRRLDKKIQEWDKQGLLTGYFGYIVSSKGNKVTYADLLEILIYSIYAKQEEQTKKLSKEVFTVVAKDIYSQALNEIPTKPKKKFSLTWEFIWALLWIPTYNKSWDSYLQLLTLTNKQEMYKQMIAIVQKDKGIKEKDLKDLVAKQTHRIISINDEKYSGVLSDTCRQLGNKIYIEPFKEDKTLQVRFIAEMDKRTTKMCEGMNNMLFYVNDWNKFYRYSDIDGRDVLYTCKGLEQGINLPPITNHFHWCRSTVTYLINTDTRKKYSNITNSWIKKNKKTTDNAIIKQYRLNEKFKFRGNEYTYDGKLVKYDLSHGEKEFAEWLSKKIDSEIKIIPNIDVNGGVSAPDYMIKGKSYDLKTLLPNNNGKQPVYRNIRDKYKQSNNFFIDATATKHSFLSLVEEAQKMFDRIDVNWVNIIGIKKDDNFIILQRK